VSFAELLVRVRGGARDPDTLDDLARAALAEGEEEAALKELVPAAERSNAALLWQWSGLLQRALDEHEQALVSFERSARLAPNDAGIAHARARVTLEAGLDAVELFDRARALAPTDGAILLGLAAARNAAGSGDMAARELATMLERAPAWTEGHEQLAQLLATLGRGEEATQSVERAIARFPSQPALWTTLFAIDLRREDYLGLNRDVIRAQAAGIGPDILSLYGAIAAAETSDERRPVELFGHPPPALDDGLALWRIRHLIRVGASDQAIPLIDQELASPRANQTWPYAATAWRLTGDERWQWLEQDPRFVQVIDLSTEIGDLGKLAATLRDLHLAKGEFLDQSVRGGTQTDGPLLSRIEAPIRQLRKAIVGAVERYVGQLPTRDERHPLLSRRRDRRVRFSGSWSVRLRSGGRHSNHVHPEGWISSALYIALPQRQEGEADDAGWFTLGEPHTGLRLDLPPWRKVEPKPGHLVLFPSWMWHGTVPFNDSERLTVAFDVRPPI
jgi:tetratricopeptide (TPR) repeat protein